MLQVRESVVEAKGLIRSFGGRRAVDGIGFTLGAGECLADRKSVV